jgi:hypothetical protein
VVAAALAFSGQAAQAAAPEALSEAKSTADQARALAHRAAMPRGPQVVSSGNAGIGNGLQVYAPVTTSVNVCGNSLSLGGSAAFASCHGGASVGHPAPDRHKPKPHKPAKHHSDYPSPGTDYPTPPPPEPPSVTPELPITGSPIAAIGGLGGVMTAGGAAMRIAGARVGAARYQGKHREAA